jgi:Xaa-Pro aminopeptidase
MHNNNDYMGGYVKYFTDVPATNGYPITVIFPREDLMTLIQHGPTGVVEQLPPTGNGLLRGVKTVMYCTGFASVGYSLAYDAEAAMKALGPFAGGAIGMVGLGTLPVSIMDHVRSGKLANTKFVDATDLVDAIRVIKSPVEMELIRRTARLQDRAMQAAFATIKPGMRERDVVAVAEPIITRGGGEQALYLACSVPANGAAGQARPPSPKHLQNRILGEGDVFHMLVESNGPGGMFTELSRTCVLGKAPDELKDECTLIVEARRQTLEMLKPGASCKEIWDAQNTWRRKVGRPEETRLYCHGQGYDLVERPLVKYDESYTIQENMNITCHPGWITSRYFQSLTDNYLIGPTGVTERLHSFPEAITEIY